MGGVKEPIVTVIPTARHRIERLYHDQVATRERSDFYAWGALDAADAFAYSLIERPQGSIILDLGCGRGAHTLHFAQSGATSSPSICQGV
jgi:hypothetical protein